MGVCGWMYVRECVGVDMGVGVSASMGVSLIRATYVYGGLLN